MPPVSDGARALRPTIPIVAMTLAGFALTLWVFYPGIWTFDARYVYQDIAKHFYGDWQSPVMTLLWALIDPLAPGPASMFLLIATFYWLSFGLLALTMGRQSFWRGALVLLLALSPPAFVFVGVIWRDVLFAVTWLLAAALAFAVAGRGAKLRLPMQAIALGLLALGVLLRPNALIAAPILVAYIAWPTKFSWKRTVIVFVPTAIALYGLVQLVYYGALGATRQHPVQSMMVFDLGGISHFTKQNQYPVTWSAAENELLLTGCYKPTEWDLFWRHEPCLFVMKRLEGDRLFGTSAVSGAWLSAIAHHPIAYIQHRTAFLWNFLTGNNLTMWTFNIDDEDKPVLDGRPAYMAVKSIHDALKPTLLFRVWPWLLICLAVCLMAWRRRETPTGAFALGLCGAGAAYVLSFFVFGVASDFRYGYLAVLASIAGAITLTSRPARIAPASVA